MPTSTPSTRLGRRWSLVLAGGDGTRLRPLTAAIAGQPIPKQYCRIMGRRSLLETTVHRMGRLVPAARTLAVVNADHVPLAGPQLASLPARNVLVQPANRDTGPGIVFGLLQLARRDPYARVVMTPSDHYVGNEPAMVLHLLRALDLVEAHPEAVALLGIAPERPDTGFGYVEPAASLGADAVTRGVQRVAAFREKPSADLAAAMVARGCLWNSFIMAYRVDRLLALLMAQRPDDTRDLAARLDDPAALADYYAQRPAWNFSRDVLTPIAPALVVLRADDTAWDDWGTPEAVERTVSRFAEKPGWWARWRAAA